MRTIFHIATKQDWETAKTKGHYRVDSLNVEGFIHLSRPHQVLNVANFLFKNQRNLLLLQVNQELVTAPIKYEGDKDNKFPHLYGPLNLDAVVGIFNFEENKDGFSLPTIFDMVGDTCVRPGCLGDEAEITNVHTHAWQQSYKGIVPDSYLDSRPLSFRSRLVWWKSVVEKKTSAKVFVAESAQNGIIGFCAVEPARDEELKSYGEISAIYCLNEFKNKGIGASLFHRGHAHLKSKNMSKIYLWILKDNPTISFYEKMGGKRMKKEKSIVLGKPLVEVVYEWADQ
ncbi:MAG: GNAT family N-acetyltransferase [Bdellovibrionaceae bacterium]|nr:GNAT family N-acetyltransferase [Pseudobdellovibrionaceae bacterium]